MSSATQILDEDGYCRKSDLLPEHCAHCRGLDDELASTVTIASEFRAAAPGRCAGCDRNYKEGTIIGRTEDNDIVCRRCFPD